MQDSRGVEASGGSIHGRRPSIGINRMMSQILKPLDRPRRRKMVEKLSLTFLALMLDISSIWPALKNYLTLHQAPVDPDLITNSYLSRREKSLFLYVEAKGVAGLGKAGGDGSAGSDKSGQQVPPEVYNALTYAGIAFLFTLSVPLILYGLNRLLNEIEDCFGCGPSSRKGKKKSISSGSKKRKVTSKKVSSSSTSSISTSNSNSVNKCQQQQQQQQPYNASNNPYSSQHQRLRNEQWRHSELHKQQQFDLDSNLTLCNGNPTSNDSNPTTLINSNSNNNNTNTTASVVDTAISLENVQTFHHGHQSDGNHPANLHRLESTDWSHQSLPNQLPGKAFQNVMYLPYATSQHM